uniref:Rap-GAP domain-containing protein n=1 Tax=Strigamia maritima TaxID=126957 RepID=T1JGD1_STRMM
MFMRHIRKLSKPINSNRDEVDFEEEIAAFSKKPHADIKKSTLKILDCKKDTATRLKHLRVVLDNVDITESKTFFEANHSQIYYIFYDQFITVENLIKQRAHKSHRDELDSVLYIFEKILVLLPELLAKKWQCHSIGRIIKKLLHPGNNFKLRREAMRLFLLWYQALGEAAPSELNYIYSCLVPGLQPKITLESIISGSIGADKHSTEMVAVNPIEIYPLLPPQIGEKQPENLTQFFLENLLDLMVTQVIRIEWREKSSYKQQSCFNFLFERFKKHYLLFIFPDFSCSTSLYKPNLDLPDLRADLEEENRLDYGLAGSSLNKVAVIQWVSNFTHTTRVEVPIRTLVPVMDDLIPQDQKGFESSGEKESNCSYNSNEYPSYTEYIIARDTFYCNRENVNFVHEIFRQAFLLSFIHASTLKKVIVVYRDWVDNKSFERPVFMLEPDDGLSMLTRNEQCNSSYIEGPLTPESKGRLRNDSYLGAIHREALPVRAGMQNTLQVFITNAANVFLLENKSGNHKLLEDQVDLCKRILNLYRFMVMNLTMEQKTWEQLLLVLLQITSLILKENPPIRKDEVLGGKLASVLFQTLIVTWIRANMNVVISAELWDHFLSVLFSLTQWEELIKEWAKTMETLTRVLARLVYGLDLTDLPLDRLSEQKQKKRRGRLNPSDQRASFSRSWSRQGADVVIYKNQSMSAVIPRTSPLTQSRNSNRERFRASSGGNHSKESRNSNSEQTSRISRSASEGNLTSKNQLPFRRSSRESPDNVRSGTSIISSLEQEIEGIMCNVDESMKKVVGRDRFSLRRRSKSLESLRFGRAASSTPSCISESSGECRSRTPSPSPSSGLESTSVKDSPMQIDVITEDNSCDSSEVLDENREEQRSVIAGGMTRGWLPDVAVVVWKRMLGALSDVNQIKDPEIHAQVFKSLIDLFETLVKIRENQGVTQDNQSTPPPPEYIPPLHLISPWLFKALTLPEKYLKGQLFAYRLLCTMSARRQDMPLSKDHLVLFYRALHQGLVGTNQDIINTIVQYCGPRFFTGILPGSTMLVLDFIYAADTILSSSELKGVPRTEVASILGSLLCFPHLYKEMQVLQPNSNEFTSMITKDSMDHIINVVIKAGKREPAGLARCIALSSLGIYLYSELVHGTFHSRMKDAVNVLLNALRFNNKIVGQVASDMLLLLSDHSEALLQHFPDVPRLIIQILANTLNNLLPSNDALAAPEDKKLLISIMFCLGEWCMKIPKSYLLQEDGDKCLLLIVFKVFNLVVSGKWTSNFYRTELIDPDFDPNIQLDNLKEGTYSAPGTPKSQITSPTQDLVPLLETSPSQSNTSSPSDGRKDWNVVKLAARTIMSHLVNHLNHFPMGIGAARMTSLVTEHDDIDIPGMHADELSTEIFHAPNVQFFVLNNDTLISFVELPTLEVPGGGVTAGLTTAKSQVRVITRDMSGKFCWECSILHGPPDYTTTSTASSIELTSPFQSFTMERDDSEFSPPSPTTLIASPRRHTQRHRSPDVLPLAEDTAEDMDNLDDLLQYIGHSSPECLDKPGQPLNIPSFPPVVLSEDLETETISTILYQRSYEMDFITKNCNNLNMTGKPLKPSHPREPDTAFHHCRVLLDQLGFMSWEKRTQFDLLKKNEKLLRELRNLDNQKCRETHKIAVIYVAEGQEDKNSVLLNCGGSQAYEEFVAALAWEIELETHTGFMGGLQKNKSSGDTAPYYATSFNEVIFHVATRMPSNNDESKLQKLRHLGNDEVHIVWSEHTRDYRRGIIATEFCDVLIVIYPLPNKLFRIQINRKAEVPYFGPLFSGAIVDFKVLPGLVRATAINASRAKRSMLPFYQSFYEERAKALDTVIQNHKDPTTFEAFTANVFSPAHPKSFQFGFTRALGSSFTNSCEHTCLESSSNLAAALIDPHTTNSNSPPLRSRPLSLSTSEHPSPRDQSSRVATHSFSYFASSNPKPSE